MQEKERRKRMADKKETQKPAAKAATKQQKQKPKMVSINARIDRLIDRENTSLKAIASANIGGAFAVHGIKITDSQKGLFVSMPSTSYTDREGNVQYNDTFHPITAEAREELISKVKAAYEQALEEQQEAGQAEEEEEGEATGEEMQQVGQAM